MGWEDRDYAYDDDPRRAFGGAGGDWRGMRPKFDNPMTWSLPLVRIADINVRVHVIFILYIVIELFRSMVPTSSSGFFALGLTAFILAVLFGIVLVHEFGHALTCRKVGGSAEEILMWPLGGLAYCMPPNHWKAHFWTAAGGPLVNVFIFFLIAPVLGIITQTWLGMAIPNPLNMYSGLLQLDSWWLQGLYIANSINLILLLFNLLPIFPLDGGRIVQTLLWPKFGYVKSMRYAVRTGFVGAIGLGVFGAVTGEWMLIAIAIFGGVTCYMTVKQLEVTEQFMGYEDVDYSASLEPPAEPVVAKPSRAERRQAEKEHREQAKLAEEESEVDRILSKISESGMESLTRRERDILNRATERKRTS